MADMRKETDSLGVVEVPADKLWGAQTQRSLEHFSIGKDLIPREMITAYATLKKAAAIANHDGKRLDDQRYKLIVQTCDEILTGQHHDMFPLHVWMTGSGTQFNMNVNEVISNRCAQIAGTPLGSHTPVHPNDHVMLRSATNPGGLPIEIFDQLRASVLADRSQFWKDLSMPFYGYNRPGSKISEGVRESFWLQGMMAGLPASYFCIKAFSETDMTEDLKNINVPTLILHGDDDQIVPIADSAILSAKLVKNAELKIYKGAPHGMCTTEKDKVNQDLLAFISGNQRQ